MHSGVCVENRPAGWPKKRWFESVKECVMEKNVNLIESRIMGHIKMAVVCGPRPVDEPH